MSTSLDPLEWLVRPHAGDNGIDRKALAGLLLDIARNVKPEVAAQAPDGPVTDIRMEQLRTLLLGRELQLLARLRDALEDPEQFAEAVGRILPTAFARATDDARLGQVLAPALEKATQSSVRADPHTLVNILYPLIVPAIRKSIGESIDKTFQSLNQTLKYSLTWRGLKWRWEAWRTGVTFAEVVLRHTLVYQVEHVFLIHRHTGLLIAHVAAENAASQDPQLVSSMLTAIQDFVRDSFTGAEHQGLDTMRLGELTLWSEPGSVATLVAVIRGNPPEELHETLVNALSRIHAERHQALADFDGDSSGFADVEAELTECVALRQEAPQRARFGFPWLALPITVVLLLLVSTWFVHRWQEDRRWDDYVAQLRTQPGLVVTETGRRNGKFWISGLRDPLAADPAQALRAQEIDPADVVAQWAPYQAFAPRIVLKRLQASLDPPSGVTFSVVADRIVAQGSAPADWLQRARAAGEMLPAGAPALDLSAVRNLDAAADRRWDEYLARLRQQPGIVITQTGRRDGKFLIAGLRDPLAADPERMLVEAGIDPAAVAAHWSPYQGFDSQIVLKRLQRLLNPPASVRFAVDGDRIVAQGSAPSLWLEKARSTGRMLPAGSPSLDLSAVQSMSDGAIGNLREAIQSRTIHFNAYEPLPAPGQMGLLDQVAGDVNRLAAMSSALHLVARVTLIGHADGVGADTQNLSLSLARAEAVRALLKKRGVDPDLLSVRGAGALEPVEAESSEAARSANRRVSFTVGLEELP